MYKRIQPKSKTCFDLSFGFVLLTNYRLKKILLATKMIEILHNEKKRAVTCMSYL